MGSPRRMSLTVGRSSAVSPGRRRSYRLSRRLSASQETITDAKKELKILWSNFYKAASRCSGCNTEDTYVESKGELEAVTRAVDDFLRRLPLSSRFLVSEIAELQFDLKKRKIYLKTMYDRMVARNAVRQAYQNEKSMSGAQELTRQYKQLMKDYNAITRRIRVVQSSEKDEIQVLRMELIGWFEVANNLLETLRASTFRGTEVKISEDLRRLQPNFNGHLEELDEKEAE